MPAYMYLAAEAATLIGILPLLWLGWLHFRGKRLDVAWWWLAGAFAISWIADNASRWTGHPFVSMVYPVSQAVLVGFVFLSRREALALIVLLVTVGTVNLLWHGIDGRDVFLRSVAWGSVLAIVAPLKQLGRLRTALLVYFGLGLLAWMWYAIDPGWPSWSGYQVVRLVGIAMFCWAALKPGARLRISA